MRHLPTVLVVAAAIALGVAAIVYGGIDDSPGLQLIGVVIILGAVALRVAKRRSDR